MWLDLAGLLDRIFGRRGKVPATKFTKRTLAYKKQTVYTFSEAACFYAKAITWVYTLQIAIQKGC